MRLVKIYKNPYIKINNKENKLDDSVREMINFNKL